MSQNRVVLCILSLAAGFVDTATFVGADGMFSAHVTGNFVVLSASLFKEGGIETYLKLLTFPVFALSVVLVSHLKLIRILNFKQSLFLISFFLLLGSVMNHVYDSTFVPLIFVFAMGIQNAAHKLFVQTGPTSTVMTGNVTSFFLELVKPGKGESYFRSFEAISSFFVGCLLGALGTTNFGLSSILLPGVFVGILAVSYKEIA